MPAGSENGRATERPAAEGRAAFGGRDGAVVETLCAGL